MKSTTGSGREYLVDFETRQCTCGEWQHFQAPCPEVIACGVATGELTRRPGKFLRSVFPPSAFCRTLREINIREPPVPVPIPQEPVSLVNRQHVVIDGGVDPQIMTLEQMRAYRASQGTPDTDEYIPPKPPLCPSTGILLPPADDDMKKYHGNDKRYRYQMTGTLKKSRGIFVAYDTCLMHI